MLVVEPTTYLPDGVSNTFYTKHDYRPGTLFVLWGGFLISRGEIEETGLRSFNLDLVPKIGESIKVIYEIR